MATVGASVRVLRQVAALTRWVGAGRKLTQTGQLTMADARHLIALLKTGDEIDPVIGDRLFRTGSSADLPDLAIGCWTSIGSRYRTTYSTPHAQAGHHANGTSCRRVPLG
jgi:hypothetical protein